MFNTVGNKPSPAQWRDQMEERTKESIDHIQWASAQGLALSKLQVFSAMAKKINDQ